MRLNHINHTSIEVLMWCNTHTHGKFYTSIYPIRSAMLIYRYHRKHRIRPSQIVAIYYVQLAIYRLITGKIAKTLFCYRRSALLHSLMVVGILDCFQYLSIFVPVAHTVGSALSSTFFAQTNVRITTLLRRGRLTGATMLRRPWRQNCLTDMMFRLSHYWCTL